MFAIFVSLDIDVSREREFLDASTMDAVGSVNDEPGCLRFDISRDAQRAGRFHFYEVYRDRDAFAAHTEASHFLAWKEQVESMLVSEPQIQELSTCVPLDEAWTPQQAMGQNGGAQSG